MLWVAIFLWGIVTVYVFATWGSTEFRLNDQLALGFGSGILTNRTDIDFMFGGNQKVWMYLPRGLETLSTPEVVVLNWGSTWVCFARVKGLYYNNERGERIWPMDLDTLSWLQAMDPSYNTMQLTGGLFTNCSGNFVSNYQSVYGMITITNHATTYYLMGWTNYNFPANMHGTALTGSLTRTNTTLSWYLWDSYGGIGVTTWWNSRSFTGNVVDHDTLYTLSGRDASFTWAIHLSWVNESWFIFPGTGKINVIGLSHDILAINIGGFAIQTTSGTWDGKLIPPTTVPNGDTHTATFGEVWLPVQTDWSTTRAILSTFQAWSDTASLVAHGWYFSISFVVTRWVAWNVLKIYRSENGSTRNANTPDTTCVLNSNLICSFRTDHLSYFTTMQETITGDLNGINNDTLTGNLNGGNGAAILTKDNCKNTTSTLNNLSWANADGIDYSPSYYDHTCEWPLSAVPEPSVAKTAIQCSLYSNELNWAYSFARNFDITTIDQCSNVNIYGKLLRKDLAKMIVNFAENVFDRTGIVVNDSNCASFSDISNETQETQQYIQKACEYGLMWLATDGITPQGTFNPYGEVTRAQFWTILSRFIRWSEYNAESGTPYYLKHLQVLKKVGIMQKINVPMMQELRGRVMLTMERIYEKK